MKVKDILSISLKDLTSRKLILVIVIFGLIVGISSTVIVISQSQGMVKSIESIYAFLRPNVIIVYPNEGSFTSQQVSILSSLKYVKCAYPAINGTVYLKLNGQNYRAYLLGIDNLSIILSYTLLSGVSNLGEGIYVPVNFYVPVSNNLVLQIEGKNTITTFVSGVINVSGTIFERFGKISYSIPVTTLYIYSSLTLAEKVFNTSNYSFIVIVTEGSQYDSLVIKEIENIYNVTVYSPGVYASEIASQYTYFSVYLYGIVVVGFLTSVITNFAGLVITFNKKIREIGIMLALGMTRRGVSVVYLLQAVIIGIVGGFLGILIGLYITNQIILLKISYTPIIYVNQLLEILGVSVLISIVGGIYPVIRILRLNPVEAIRVT
ncbi:ABC transporter permease [Sulfurisphaera javensis]|uniref:ABC transporter permease n=1 Tax=Sulfurisphaera javensis TaxID=2049879 RepID=A0AAT9GU76_9CREN